MYSSFKKRAKRALKSLLIIVSMTVIVTTSGDALRFNPAQEAAAPYSYDIIAWHFENFLSKWTHRVVRFMPWNGLADVDRQAMVAEYFELAPLVGDLKNRIQTASSGVADSPGSGLDALERELEVVRAKRKELRPDVEEALEAAISSVAKQQRLGAVGDFILPPVDIRLTEPPKVLITSPRDRIERTYDVLVDPHVRVEDREAMESQLLDFDDLSAVVLDIGGVATYPASLYNGGSLIGTLRIAAHEWLHHYLFFKPLGQNMFKSSDMQILNETLADLAGKEIGETAIRHFTTASAASRSQVSVGNFSDSQNDDASKVEEFSFNREMRETRARVDELLALGLIAEAENYMEQRRQVFVANGFNIRKLNQAYFAFNGTYADGAASSSPIAEQLKRYRDVAPNLGAFVKKVAGFSTYQKFLDGLADLEQ